MDQRSAGYPIPSRSTEDAKSQERFIQVGQSAWAIELACYRVSLR